MKENQITHNDGHKIIIPFTKDINENIKNFEMLFEDCQDVVKRRFPIGKEQDYWAYIAYIDVMIDRNIIESSILDQLMVQVRQVPKELGEIPIERRFDFIKNGGLTTADIKELTSMDEVSAAVLSGDTVLFIEGYDKAIMIATKGFPNRGVQEPDTEVVIRGSKEGFSEAFRFNTVLIRRRIRDTKLKVKQSQVGVRSRTDIGLMYIEGLVRPSILKEIEDRLTQFKVDAIFESGQLEQLIEDDWKSVFPQFQVTQRPDKAASAILEGRIVLIVDNTPFVLILPATLNCFFQASEDYYNRWQIMSAIRLLRYIAAFFAIALPGLYIALTTYHPSMLPTTLAFSFAASREGVPFPAVLEIVVMELAFELLREAGIRLPGPIGSTIGIVGGLIIGQSAVEANLVSPIIVIVVALTAISNFAVPGQSLTEAFRILKFFIIAASATLGLYGFWLALLVILIHLASLKSFNLPYLLPYVSSNLNDYNDLGDSLLRPPSFLSKKRPIFTNWRERRKLVIKKKGE
ncbi:spore germination protein [Natranaerovirga hydrolytica]|uniref:Spore germination protein n=1 Tax=Natranaerovirga hydrolytica TaxID=680378 RepID=A0A4R1MKE4_9FIRM|nr:spore germination protein [Natranaerovirga hydrolytica]TCK93288.1 spore germination protein [Natranaerovirga hydrolytica]